MGKNKSKTRRKIHKKVVKSITVEIDKLITLAELGLGASRPLNKEKRDWINKLTKQIEKEGEKASKASKSQLELLEQERQDRAMAKVRDQEIKVLLPGAGKWTWTLSEDLQFHDALTREVNLEEAISTLLNFDFEGQIAIGEKKKAPLT